MILLGLGGRERVEGEGAVRTRRAPLAGAAPAATAIDSFGGEPTERGAGAPELTLFAVATATAMGASAVAAISVCVVDFGASRVTGAEKG